MTLLMKQLAIRPGYRKTIAKSLVMSVVEGSVTGIRQQRGSTLLVALIMLVLLTLIAVSAINSTSGSVQMVGNAQFREEANAAAQQAIEQVLSSPDFMTTPPAAQNIDVNLDGTADFTVTFAPAPACLSAKPATYGEPGVPTVCSSSIGAVCFWTMWEIRAVVSDPSTGAAVNVRQGVKTITGLNAAVTSCGI